MTELILFCDMTESREETSKTESREEATKSGKCIHDRHKRFCKKCKGSMLCEHLRHKNRCMTCRQGQLFQEAVCGPLFQEAVTEIVLRQAFKDTVRGQVTSVVFEEMAAAATLFPSAFWYLLAPSDNLQTSSSAVATPQI